MMSYKMARDPQPPEEKGMKEKKPQFKKSGPGSRLLARPMREPFTAKDHPDFDVMNDERQFISLTDVDSKDFASPKAYLIQQGPHRARGDLRPDLEREP
jgi:hypothetical protein